ncbi:MULTISPECIES: S9 family peptidase [unclassified Janthinobacterium]|uniref:dipeptidyl-peptidase 5 n=1 Tax=unclassified Janthinobacterium TaxID=2610881 RepID=UPI0016131A47|nr:MULTISPECIES: S9 family peptidase [unclassified Janthinobacterium]MBB5371558.1 dipeptidyl aminopeptidase/acylaminoacyl peptidase [Janthinobacterium sp. K2C7]MBB5384374.1 dipeptidyl aminopeptidase/acylaminoacyl peptidase [Janthinobacterium sp. K2Li3]MBB5389650.1 dipeptidyl aminopeptidase/acylaminoacyl peptidase [Janthinobacterium sp. K2E3]
MTSIPSRTTAPYGAWPSPISAALVAAGASPLTQLALGGADGSDVYWLAGRASEAGRNTLLRQRGARVDELTPVPFNVRTRVHEYGGGAYVVDGDTVYFSHFADNRLYRQAGDSAPEAFSAGGTTRHADFIVDHARSRLIAVREQHPELGHAHPENSLAAVQFDGSETVLARGHDFYAAPRLSPDGSQLAWISWDHPRLPWQGTELWLADVHADGSLGSPRLIAGGERESICQPEWSPNGLLHFVSDSSGWWNLYRLHGADIEALCPMEAEFATPHWTFGGSMYGFLSSDEIICTYIQQGVSHLGQLTIGSAKLETIAHPYQEIRELRVGPGFVALLGGSPTIALELARIDLSNNELEVLAQSITELPALDYLSVPRSLSFPSNHGRTAHAFFYPPHNVDVQAPEGTLPPVIVISHGGPTSMASNTLKLATQYWTSRGIGVLDVNYGGSSGFGREYRDALKGQWGIVDVEDCIAGARYLTAHGLADPERLIIRGGSAGGFTTLCALTFHDVFKVGASYYGVSDLKGLDLDSHKFEARYTDYLIASQPQAEVLYRERSPIHHTDKLSRPMIFLQGLDDKVVPPQQSELMVDALKARGVPVAYVPLEGEGHGFRKAENIVRTLDAELYFYQRVLKLTTPAGEAPVHIDNLPA